MKAFCNSETSAVLPGTVVAASAAASPVEAQPGETRTRLDVSQAACVRPLIARVHS